MAGLQRRERAQVFVAGRWLARRLLAERLGGAPESLQLPVDPSGRSPALQGFWFSISHSGDWVAAAVGPERLGLDIELPRPGRDWAGMAALIGLAGCTDADDFHRHWVLGEAWLKAQAREFTLPELAGLRWMPDAQGEGLTLRHEQGLHLGLVAPAALAPALPPGWRAEGRWRALSPRLGS